MYRVLLVDDEILIRERIAGHIPWNELGYVLAGICEHGKEAVKIIEKEQIDLILTDICMPYMDGLELAQYVYERKKNIKVVIISGYDEFDYAKKALKYQVFSYVLKPVTASEMIGILKKVRKVMDLELQDRQAQSNYKSSLPVLKNQFLMQIALGDMPEGIIMEKAGEFGLELYGTIFCTAILYPRIEKDQKSQILLSEILVILEKKQYRDVLIFTENEEKIILYIQGENSVQIKNRIQNLSKEITDDLMAEMDLETAFLIGPCVMDVSGLSLSYQKAMELKEFIYLGAPSHILEWDTYQKFRKEIDKAVKGDGEKRIVLAVQSNLLEDVKKEIFLIGDEGRKKWLSKNRVIVRFHNMILAIMNSFEQLGIEDDKFFQDEQEVVSCLYQCRYLSEIEEGLLKFCRCAMEVVNRNRGNYGERQAAIALEYINEHYGESSLSLQSMCARLAISVSYFSTAFKDYTGRTFVEALTQKRMEKAKELFEKTILKTYEVAEKCGYSDANYFSATFKKAMGMTPREYSRYVNKRENQ